MLNGSDCCLGSVFMVFKHAAEIGFKDFALVVIESAVFLFINGFQFGVEQAQLRLAVTLCFKAQPVVHFVGRYIVHENSLLEGGECIGAFAAKCAAHLIVFVRNRILRSFSAQAVNFVINVFPFRIICCFAIHFIHIRYRIQQGLFLFKVLCSQFICPLKKHVLKIMCKSRCIVRIIFASRFCRNHGIESWRILVNTQENG